VPRPASKAWRRRRAWPGAVLIVAALLRPAVLSADTPLELAVKATYLYKFAPFVDWPAGALGPPRSPFSICVVGDDPFGQILDTAVAGQRIEDRPVIVRRMPLALAASGCAIAFVAGSRKQTVAAALRALSDTPVLTVTDGASTPGIVDFAIDEGRVRFRFDLRAATEHGLSVRSQLLGLALSVTNRSH
jgi:hypothetical protein